jgi:hypothetical protein
MPPSRPKNEQDTAVQGWIQTNNVEALSAFLTEHPELLEHEFILFYNTGYGWGLHMEYTLLQHAVKKNNLDIVNLLISRGADLNNGGNWETPPIFYSVVYEPIFFALLNAGASVTLTNSQGMTLKQWVLGEQDNPLITQAVRDAVMQEPKPKQRNNYAILDNEEDIFGEEIEDGTTVAFLNPTFRGQRIVAVRADGTPTDSWKQVLASKKNPFTNQLFNPANVELQKVVVGPSVNLNGGKRKTRARKYRNRRKNKNRRSRKH